MRTLPLVALITCVATPTIAQERLELFTSLDTAHRIIELDVSVSGFGDVRHVTPTPAGSSRPVSLAGARYLVWPTDLGVAIFDRRSRSQSTASLPGTIGAPVTLLPDTRSPRVIVWTAAGSLQANLYVVDARSAEARLLFTTTETLTGIAYAAAAGHLFVNRTSTGITLPPQHATTVIDVATGQVVRELTRGDWLFDAIASEDGRFMWGIESPFGSGYLQVVDGLTGATHARGALTRTPLALDADSATVVAPNGEQEYLVALDALTLTERWRSRLDIPAPLRGHSVTQQVLPGRWMTGAYAVHVENRFDGVCQRLDVAAFDPAGTRRSTAHLLPLAGASGRRCSGVAVLVRSPFAPRGLTASSAASAVTLAWGDPGDTSEFELEYGLAPGQRLGALRVGQTSQVTIPGVPPGVYYVRVIGHNEVGASPPSAEVRVVVQ